MENLLFLGGVNAVPEDLPVLFSGVSEALAPGLAFGVHSVLSVPGHALWSSIWGYALGRAKFMAARLPAVRGAALALVAAWLLHGLHNGLTMLSPIYGTIGLAVLALVLWQWVRRNIAAALRDSPFAEPIAVAPEGADLPGVAD